MSCGKWARKIKELMQNEQLEDHEVRGDIVLDDKDDKSDKEKWSDLVNLYI